QALSVELRKQIGRPYWIDNVGRSDLVEIRVQLESAVMRVMAKRSAAYASNSEIFLLWMVGTSLVLITVAILFLRNQIRPILRLPHAAGCDATARERDRDLRQGQRCSQFPPPRGLGGAPRRLLLHRDEIAGRTPHRAAHHHA